MFTNINEDWIFEYFTKNREDLIKIKDEIDNENYNLFKKSINDMVNNGNEREKKEAVHIILINETDYENKIFSEIIQIQEEAIKRFGNSESIERLKKKLKDKDIKENVILED